MALTITEINPDGLDLAAARCEASVWGHPNPGELLIRNREFWSRQHAPLLLIARNDAGEVLGFRYAHAIEPEKSGRILYDQNGGVRPDSRRQGIARALLREQHQQAKKSGYTLVRTDVAVPLKPMIILNLQEGFEITGLDWHPEFKVNVLRFEKKL